MARRKRGGGRENGSSLLLFVVLNTPLGTGKGERRMEDDEM